MINRVVLVGRLTRDPEVRMTPAGVSVVTVSLAVDTKTKNADGTRGTAFVNVTCWRQSADIIGKYCTKGTQIGVDGYLQSRNYQRKDGTNASVVEVVADSVTLLGSKAGNNSSVSGDSGFASDPEPNYGADDIMAQSDGDLADDDLPF